MAKICPNCGELLDTQGFCKHCHVAIEIYEKISIESKKLYNLGLKKVEIRDLSGAIDLLNKSIKFDKKNINARNLLGLVYLEIGEPIMAFKQWVVSKNMKPIDNEAITYMDQIQNNQVHLDKLNNAIKKYNQALVFVNQNSIDLAIIQLRAVIGLNPNFTKAYCLLALCLIHENQMDKAKRKLQKVLTIDHNHYTAKKYMTWIQSEGHPVEAFEEEKEKEPGYFGLPSLGHSAKVSMNNSMFQFAAVLVGVGIGLAVMAFLIVPSMVNSQKNKNIEALNQVNALETNQSILEEQVKSMEQSIQQADTEIDTLSTNLEQNQNQLLQSEKLLMALSLYEDNNAVEAARLLEEVDPSALSESALATYEKHAVKIFPEVALNAYNQGYRDYRNGRFEEAITNLKLAYSYEKDDYYSDEALYYLARSYQRLNQNDLAISTYQKMLDTYPNANFRSDATYFLNALTNN
ncbi:tetratricopeptide repeat protein [Petrocella sp. FN5]|uniref:tetratricopeptide repeat protein n=1 Tax=Petrocella sp. FN5 TaxID=3032002 RepID=UPI0023DB1746|nr:tetratricopeptide repeat protein [Petrocella sp. FN5]MDF1616674.1 tetratricopeptide repeat protein [Petrocella sp. FN5]